MIKFKKNGFSIIELIIAGSISITAIGIGYSLLQIALKGNKIDETQMGINGRINDTLDFTYQWYYEYFINKKSAIAITDEQINMFMEKNENN